ncbi:MAG: ribosome maturation factor RimM [bacterium]
MEKLLSVGKILNFHGMSGEVKVGYTVGKENQLTQITEFHVLKDSEIIFLNLESIRFHKKFAFIKFKEISSVNEAAKLKGACLKIPKNKINNDLEEDEFYIDDLVGLNTFDSDGKYLGKISAIINTGIEDLLAVKNSENQEYLVPFVRDLVPEVSLEENKIIIKDIPGLFE